MLPHSNITNRGINEHTLFILGTKTASGQPAPQTHFADAG